MQRFSGVGWPGSLPAFDQAQTCTCHSTRTISALPPPPCSLTGCFRALPMKFGQAQLAELCPADSAQPCPLDQVPCDSAAGPDLRQLPRPAACLGGPPPLVS